LALNDRVAAAMMREFDAPGRPLDDYAIAQMSETE
jgi:hypothetical protein